MGSNISTSSHDALRRKKYSTVVISSQGLPGQDCQEGLLFFIKELQEFLDVGHQSYISVQTDNKLIVIAVEAQSDTNSPRLRYPAHDGLNRRICQVQLVT